MSKEVRATVRMSEELDQWIKTQADAREMDKAAFIRMCMAERKAGVDHPVYAVSAPGPAVARDVLDVASYEQPQDEHHHSEEAALSETAFDINDIVSDGLNAAEERGLTVPRPAEEVEEFGGVRPLRRPMPRFSPSNAPAHLRGMS